MQNFKAGSLTIYRKSNQPTNEPNTLFSGPKFCLLFCLWMQCCLCWNHCGRVFLHVRSCDAEQMLRHNISTHKSLNWELWPVILCAGVCAQIQFPYSEAKSVSHFCNLVTERWNANLNCSVLKEFYGTPEILLCNSLLPPSSEIWRIQLLSGDADSCTRNTITWICSCLNIKLYKLGLFPKLKFHY